MYTQVGRAHAAQQEDLAVLCLIQKILGTRLACKGMVQYSLVETGGRDM